MLYFKVLCVICVNAFKLYVICHLYSWMILILLHFYYLSINYTCNDNYLHSILLSTQLLCTVPFWTWNIFPCAIIPLDLNISHSIVASLIYIARKICHINENIIGILIMSMNVCLIIRCKNKHIQKVTEITLLKILTFVSICRIVTGWAWRF